MFLLVKFSYNNSVNVFTKVYSLYHMYDAQPITTSNLMRLPKREKFLNKVATINDFVEHIHRVLHHAKEKFLIAQNRQK